MGRSIPMVCWALSLSLLLPLAGRSDPPALAESAPATKTALSEVIRGQLAAFHAGDFAKAYTFASAQIQSKYDQADFEQMVRLGFPFLTRFTSTEFGPVLDDGENGLVYVRLSDDQGRELYLYSLKREASGWKIIGVSQRDEEPSAPEPKSPPELPPFSA